MSSPEPAVIEETRVASLVQLSRALRALDAHRLFFAGLNWDNLFVSGSGFAAPAPSVARGSYTRDARRVQRQRQLARRGGVAGLARALAR